MHKAHELGLKIVSYQILGLPNESLASMIQTLAFNARLPVLLGASPFYLTPDAPIAHGLDFTQDDYLRARLTAMAIEGADFKRDDIYTLFVTTRIINFLKGLPITASVELMDLIDQPRPDQRTRIAFELLKLLVDTKRLFFWTKHGLAENRKFNTELFARVLSLAGEVTCQNGKEVAVAEFAGTLRSQSDLMSVQLGAI